MDNGEQHQEEASTRKHVIFNVQLYVNATARHKRAYTIKVEAKYSRDGEWRPVNRIVKSGGSTLDQYANLGFGQAVWIEDATNATHRFNVEAHTTTQPVRYKITIAKPDFAFIQPLQTTITTTNGNSTNMELIGRIRNSAGTALDRAGGQARVFCVNPISENSKESTLGKFSSIDKNSVKTIKVKTVCEGATPSTISTSRIHLHISARRSSSGNFVSDAKTSVHMVSKTIQWPFVGNTLWHSQSTLVGGVQISAKQASRCTLSFPLKLTQSSGSDRNALSTTGHCVDDNATTARRYVWKQGSFPLQSTNSNVRDLGPTHITRPAYSACTIRLEEGTSETEDDCRKGDHVYALSPVLGSTSIFRPKTENTSTQSNNLDPNFDFFVEHPTNNRFTIVSARPPAAYERVAKVGRTTGWTTGVVFEDKTATSEDPTCSASPVGKEDNDGVSDDDDYFECFGIAKYYSDSGDSGAPVFAFQSEGSTNVILVGVHWGKKGRSERAFIPIDRIYAESLRQGYDWKPALLRPVPVLDRTTTLIEERPEKLERTGNVLRATFEAKDFSRGPGLTYKAAVFRNGARVLGIGEVTTFTDHIVSVEKRSVSVKRAQFDISSLRGAGTLTVAVRACTAETIPKCGGYGSRGSASVILRMRERRSP